MTDRIRIDGLLVRAVVGVHDWERRAPRDVRIDLALDVDLAVASATDQLEDTVDYDILARQVHDQVAALAPRLIETVASIAADVCLAHPKVLGVEVTVHKHGAVELARSVSVTLRRRARRD